MQEKKKIKKPNGKRAKVSLCLNQNWFWWCIPINGGPTERIPKFFSRLDSPGGFYDFTTAREKAFAV